MEELRNQQIEQFEFWDGIYLPSIKKSINLAHKQIVEYANVAGWEEVMIAEDDIKFSSPGAWDYFLSRKPGNYDLYLGGVFLGQPDESGIVKDFTGLTLYCVNQKFYNTFLGVPEEEHLDIALAGLGKYVVCDPFVVTQHDGWSSNTGKWEEYGELQKNRRFF